jgi:hypothetical protein
MADGRGVGAHNDDKIDRSSQIPIDFLFPVPMHAPLFPICSSSHTANRYFGNNNRVITDAVTNALGWLMWAEGNCRSDSRQNVYSPSTATRGPLCHTAFSKDGCTFYHCFIHLCNTEFM